MHLGNKCEEKKVANSYHIFHCILVMTRAETNIVWVFAR